MAHDNHIHNPRTDYVRVVRVLEYSGLRGWIEVTLDRSAVRPVLAHLPNMTGIREVYCSLPLPSLPTEESDERTNTVMFRIENWNPGHTTFSVFVGHNEGARGNCGKLTLRTDEFKELMQTVFNAVEITCNHPEMALQRRELTAYCRACERNIDNPPKKETDNGSE